MQWNRSNTIALASTRCTTCFGLGLRPVRGGPDTACHCVCREIFRVCFRRFRECVAIGSLNAVTWDYYPGGSGSRAYARKREDFGADFILTTKRTLNEEEYRIFRYHHLLGANWKLCCRRLKMDRGLFFHSIYRIQERLGRVFAEMEPYSLFPPDAYFTHSCEPVQACIPPEPTRERELLIDWRKRVA